MSVRILLSCALSAAVFTTSAEVAVAQRHGGGGGHSHSGGGGHHHGGGGGHHHGGGGGHYHGGGGHHHGGGGYGYGGGGYGRGYGGYYGGYGGYGRYYGGSGLYIGLGLGYGGLGYGGYGSRYYGSGYGSGYYGSGYYGGSGGYYGSGYSTPVYYDSSYGTGSGYAVAASDAAPASGYNPPPPQAGGGVIEIASLADTGATLKYALDEFPYDIQPGQVQRVQYDRPWVIEFHRGGSNGIARYSLAQGRYKFVGTDQGWELVSVAGQPAVIDDAQSGTVTELPPSTPVPPKRPVPTPPTPMPPTPNE